MQGCKEGQDGRVEEDPGIRGKIVPYRRQRGANMAGKGKGARETGETAGRTPVLQLLATSQKSVVSIQKIVVPTGTVQSVKAVAV